MPIRLVLADDHPIVLRGLAGLFEAENDMHVVASCVDGVEALAAVRTHTPDVLVLDLKMPRLDGLQVLHELHREALDTRMLMDGWRGPSLFAERPRTMGTAGDSVDND